MVPVSLVGLAENTWSRYTVTYTHCRVSSLVKINHALITVTPVLAIHHIAVVAQ